ncbi:hypothetical protein ACJX0J_013390 [Zea mays]
MFTFCFLTHLGVHLVNFLDHLGMKKNVDDIFIDESDIDSQKTSSFRTDSPKMSKETIYSLLYELVIQSLIARSNIKGTSGVACLVRSCLAHVITMMIKPNTPKYIKILIIQ